LIAAGTIRAVNHFTWTNPDCRFKLYSSCTKSYANDSL
jgi:hypothetical protein